MNTKTCTLFIQQLPNQDRGVFPFVGMCVDDDDVAIQKKRTGRVFESPIRDKRRTIGESLVEQLGPLEIGGTEALRPVHVVKQMNRSPPGQTRSDGDSQERPDSISGLHQEPEQRQKAGERKRNPEQRQFPESPEWKPPDHAMMGVATRIASAQAAPSAAPAASAGSFKPSLSTVQAKVMASRGSSSSR